MQINVDNSTTSAKRKVIIIAIIIAALIVSVIIFTTATATSKPVTAPHIENVEFNVENAEGKLNESAMMNEKSSLQNEDLQAEDKTVAQFEDVDEIPGYSSRNSENVAVNVDMSSESFIQSETNTNTYQSQTEQATSEDFSWVTADTFAALDNEGKIELMGRMAQADARKSGILPSVTIAQAILESGWMESGLAQHNNLFGMKSVISGNTWGGSTWTGTVVDMETGEEYDGQQVTITAGFRGYENCWLSVQDHSAYLANAMNGDSLRYDGVVGNKDARSSVEIIKAGGYATGSSYVNSVMSVIEANDLTRFDSF